MRPLLTLFLCCLLSPALMADGPQQSATVLRDSPLMAEPFSDASNIATLAAKQQVTVLQRKGGWYQVESDQQRGWVRMSHIRFGDAAATQGDGSGLAKTLQFLSTGRSGASGVTVATGIRGLSAADVANAKPDHESINKLEAFQASPKAAKAFAGKTKLQSQQIAYLDEPADSNGDTEDSSIPGLGEDW